jgi:hypothetical protein
VVRPWFTVIRSPVDPITPGYETTYGLVAAVGAPVVLVALVTDHLDRTPMVVGFGGLVTAPLAVARWVPLGDGRTAAIGRYLAIVGGVLVAAGGRD